MEFDLRRYVRLLFKRKWWFIAVLVGTLAIGALVTAATPPVYQAHATLFVGERQVSQESLGRGVAITRLSDSLVRSYAHIISSRSTAQRAISNSGLTQSPGQIVGGLLAVPIVDTQVLRLTYQDNDPGDAERVANAVANAFVAEIEEIEPDAAGGEGAITVTVIDPAVAPGRPISPNPTRNMTLALVLGLLGGGGLAFLVDHLDQSIKSREELEQLGLAPVGAIPSLEIEAGEEIHLERDTQGLGGEAFRKLRTSIGFLGVEKPMKVLLVSSSVAQEGKTTVALNLAAAYALGGFRTLLVEADLRRPSLHRVFGTYGTRGLTTVIVGSVPLDEAIVHTETRNLSILLAGAIPPNPVELLASEQLLEVLERLRLMFDVVIVDSPPLAPVADPATLAGRCDGVLLVARAGSTDRRRLVESARVVEHAGGRLLGVALNFLRGGDSAYDYGYYYYGYRAKGTGDERAQTLQSRG